MANSLTHGLGLILSVFGLLALIIVAQAQGDDLWKIGALSLYGSSLVILYGASTLYHSFRTERLKKIFRTIDHCAIYLLIAGSYTPFTLISLQGAWGMSLFAIVWALALFGILLKVFFPGRFTLLSIVLYLAMGWLVVIAAEPMVEAISHQGILWVAGGGLFYTAGVIFYARTNLRFHHAIWHLFVLGGSLCHFFAVFFYVLPVNG